MTSLCSKVAGQLEAKAGMSFKVRVDQLFESRNCGPDAPRGEIVRHCQEFVHLTMILCARPCATSNLVHLPAAGTCSATTCRWAYALSTQRASASVQMCRAVRKAIVDTGIFHDDNALAGFRIEAAEIDERPGQIELRENVPIKTPFPLRAVGVIGPVGIDDLDNEWRTPRNDPGRRSIAHDKPWPVWRWF